MKPGLPRALVAAAVLAALVTLTGCGITASSGSDGYADFHAPRHRGMEMDTSISLGPRVLRFAANRVEDDPHTEALLRAVEGVRVSVYQLSDDVNRAALLETLSTAATDLGQDDWRPIVRVREDDETVFVLLKERETSIVGVAVLAADREEFVFVNVMGNLTPALLAQLTHDLPEGDRLAFAVEALD